MACVRKRMSPTRRSNIWLREHGLEPEPCTWHVRFPGMRVGLRKDLLGCLDALVFLDEEHLIRLSVSRAPCEVPEIHGPCIVGLQFTDETSHAKRRAKVQASPAAKRFTAAGGRIVVMSWGLRGARGKRKTWTPRIQEVTP